MIMKRKSNKPIYKSLWFWFIVAAILGMSARNNEEFNRVNHVSAPTHTYQVAENVEDTNIKETVQPSKTMTVHNKTQGLFDNLNVLTVKNDVTGNLRVTLIPMEMTNQEYIDYYKKYFKDNKEIHILINRADDTTTRLMACYYLFVTKHKHIYHEEYNAKILCSGDVLDDYMLDMETGNIVE